MAPDPLPPTRLKFLYGAGASTVTNGGFDALYPEPPAATVNPVITPFATVAITEAPTPTPRVSAIETLGALIYPDPPVETPTDWTAPLETVANPTACLGV